jgi:hypothetical protein
MGSAGSTPQILVLMTGRFDNAFLTTMQVDPARRAEFVNATAILVGDNASLSQAAKRINAAAPPDALVQNAEAWASRYDLWIMGSPSALAALPSARKGAGVPDLSAMLRSFSLGMTLSAGLRLDAVLETTSTQAAQQMAAMVHSGAAHQPEYSKNLRVTTSGSTVQISANVDQAQLSRGYSSRMNARRGGTGTLPLPEALPNPNAKPGRVVISGLDDGPKEVKLDDKK